MARFYETSDRKYLDDFIFQPNLDLAKLALLNEDKIIGDNLGELDILGAVPFNYDKNADEEYARETREKWEQKAAEATRAIMQDPLNRYGNRKLVANLKSELERDRMLGDIYKLESNYNSINSWKESLKDLTPGDRDQYLSVLQNYYANAGGAGAKKSIYSGPEAIDSEQFGFKDFVENGIFDKLGIHKSDIINTTPQGGWLVKKGDSIEELTRDKIMAGFKSHILDNSNLELRVRQGLDYFGEDDWLDENGNISFEEGSRLGNTMLRGVEATNYLHTKKSNEHLSETHAAKAAIDHSYYLKRWENENYEILTSGDIDASEFAGKNQYAIDLEREFVTGLQEDIVKNSGGKLTMKDVKKQFDNLDKIYNYADKNNLTELKKATWNKRKEIEAWHKAGDSHLIALGIDDPKALKQIKEDINSKFTQYGRTITYTIGRGYVVDPVTGQGVNMANLFGKEDWKPYEVIGKTVVIPGKGKVYIKDISPINNSLNIIPINSPKRTNKSLRENLAVGMLELELVPIKDGKPDFEAETSTFDLKVTTDIGKSVSWGNGAGIYPIVTPEKSTTTVTKK